MWKYVQWPSGLSFVEQLSAHWFRTECRCCRSSHLFLTGALSCCALCFSSEPQSAKVQRSARPPVKSTKASDTCPAQSLSYEPWSLQKAHSVGIPIHLVYNMGKGIFHSGIHTQSFDPLILKINLNGNKQGDCTSYLLCIGLFQQRHPEGRGAVASWEAKGGVDARKSVIHYHLCPASMPPKTELEGASVPTVTPLRLVWGQHLKIVKTLVSKPVMKQWCVLCATLPYSGDAYFWARRSMHRETNSLLTAPV